MSRNPPSQRYPFEADIAQLPEGIQRAHRFAFNSAVDLQQAVASLKEQVTQVQNTVGVSPTIATTRIGNTPRIRNGREIGLPKQQLPTVGVSVTITLDKRSANGKNGSLIFTNGILTGYTPAT